MYKTWWAFVNNLANARTEDGSYAVNIAQAQSIAAEVAPDYEGTAAPYNPIGLSQLFSIARKIGNSANALADASPDSGISGVMVAEAPWSRPLAEQTAEPKWLARVAMVYTDPAGVQQEGISVVEIKQVLPSSVASLQAQMALRVQDQLSTPPGTGTPRTGQLDEITSITLLAVLDDAGRPGSLHEAGRADLHPGRSHIR